VPALLTARILISVLTLPFLYRALGEPGEGWGGPARSMARRVFFSLLGAFVFFGVTERWVPAEAEPMGDAFESYYQGLTTFRLSFTPMGRSTPDDVPPLDSAYNNLRKASLLVPESAHFRRTLGIVQAYRGDYPGALKSLEKAAELVEERTPGRGTAEGRLWRGLFGPDPPSRKDLDGARPELERLGFGWMGKVGLLAAHRRLGPRAVPETLDRAVKQEAGGYALRLFVGGASVLLLLPQLALISLFVGGILIASGVLRRAPPDLHPVGAILWESFILMFASGLIPSLITGGIRRVSPEANPGLIGLMILAGDLAQCLAVLYLWWRLRARGLNLAEVGMSVRRFGSNVLIGLMAATVMTPAAVLVGLATKAISDRFFPNMAPPYHPLQGLTATSASPEIRAALFIAAAVGAPLLEELFFRGVLYGALRRRFGIAAGMLASAAFFAILHPQLPLGFLPIAFLGAGFAALYEWRQSLIPGIVAHAFNNGLIFMLLSMAFPIRG